MLMGRVMKPGEPEFLDEDTDGLIALAEEERDTCPKCGYPKVWCRDGQHQFSFEMDESVCWAAQRKAKYEDSGKWTGKPNDVQAATVLSVAFREGHDPDMAAGLDLGDNAPDVAEDHDGDD